jgi:two-component system sensor histidine kinase PilS (NtrC family)
LTIQDLTLVHQMQQRVKRQDRLAAIGQLSAAIAHEVRNPLASISGSVEMLQMFTDPDGDEDRLMQIVIREVDRLNVLIGDFLNYTRDRRHSMSTINLGDLIAETTELFRHDDKLASELSITVDLAPLDGVQTAGSSDGIKQIFWNLLRNAAQAIEGQGQITIQGRA